jgi:hypothetical protein
VKISNTVGGINVDFEGDEVCISQEGVSGADDVCVYIPLALVPIVCKALREVAKDARNA